MGVARATSALVAVLLASPPVQAWTVRVAKGRSAGPIAIDARRDVFTAISLGARRHQIAAAVVKLSGVDGAELWRRRLRAGGPERSDFIYDLEPAADGDVVAAGTLDDHGHSTFFVARLAGRDGRVRWRRLIRGREQPNYAEGASAVAVDAFGDVIATGAIEGATTAQYHATTDFAVVKLAGDSGEERWRFLLNGSADNYDGAGPVAVDARGDVYVVGYLSEASGDPIGRLVIVLMKLANDDGRLLWRSELEAAWRASSVVLDTAGDVVVAAGSHEASAFAVFKTAGATGEPLWKALVSGGHPAWQEAFQVGVLPSGDVAAVGLSEHGSHVPALTAVRLDGATGAERWRQLLRGTDGYGLGRTLAIGDNGDVIVGGQLRNRRSCYDAALARLDAETGAVVHLRNIDGTANASQCDAPSCGSAARFRCGPPRAGIDQDDLGALAVDADGRVALTGSVSDGPLGRGAAIVAVLRGTPATAPSAAPPAPRSSAASRP